MTKLEKNWWHGKTAYQIYPKSFKDTNGDGIGDLRGIIEKLPYLHDLGIEILWISPFYQSPLCDEGYDIADYRKVNPLFGTNEDLDELIEKADKLGIKIVLDLVVNHCSSEHELFKKAMANPYGKEASYFYIKEGKDGKVPNNWRAHFGGSVWEPVPGHDNLFYLHLFAKGQPDFNWQNEELRFKIYDMINYWLEKGVAGFRVDAILCIAKDLSFKDYPADSPDGTCMVSVMTNANVEKASPYLHEMRKNTFDKYNAFSVGEAFGVRAEKIDDVFGDKGYFDSVFDFSTRIAASSSPHFFGNEKLSVKQYRELIFAAQENTNGRGFLSPVFENHDEPRGVSYYLPFMWQNATGAKALAAFTLFQRGIPFVFQGQELGMTNTKFDSIYEFSDVQSKNEYKECLKHGLTEKQALDILNVQARDHARTPMQWDDSANAGFTTGTPWMKVNQEYHEVNVKKEEADPDSVLNFYKKLIAVKKDPKFHELLTYGDFKGIRGTADTVMAYYRVLGDKKFAVLTNFDKEAAASIKLDGTYTVVLDNKMPYTVDGDTVTLQPGCAVVLSCGC